MLENRPDDALVSLVETVETVETETDCHLMSCLIVIYVQSELRLFYEHINTNTWRNAKHQNFS